MQLSASQKGVSYRHSIPRSWLFSRRKHQNRNRQEELHLELEKVRAQEKALVGLPPTKGNQVAVDDQTILPSKQAPRLVKAWRHHRKTRITIINRNTVIRSRKISQAVV